MKQPACFLADNYTVRFIMQCGVPQRVQHLLFLFPDSGQNCSWQQRRRLSAQLRALPGTDEPYESSSNKEPGECLWVCWDGRGADASIWGSVGVSEAQTKLVVTWGVPAHFGLLTVDNESNWFYICCFSCSSNVTICSETQMPPMWIHLALK